MRGAFRAALHRPPRRPHAWAWLFAVAAAGGRGLVALGWRLGLPALLRPATWSWSGRRVAELALLGPVLTRLPTHERLVWLTIDDGPSDDTPAMLDLLDAHDAKATFFLVGERAAARPDAGARDRRGAATASATTATDHPQAWFWALGPARMRREIAARQATLARAHRHGAALVPRGGRDGQSVRRRRAARARLARVAWWARGFDAVFAEPAQVVARIERDLAPGAIVLLHEGAAHGRNVETLAALLRRLDELGYRTVLPEELESPAMASREVAGAAAS